MRTLIYLTLLLLFLSAALNAQNEIEHHELFTQVLRGYVKDGLVNYEKLKEDKRLENYIKQLAKTNPDSFDKREDKMAFWINAYNAYTLKFIVDEYPVESINDLHWGGLYLGSLLGTTVWDDEKVKINGKKISLNYIEHSILRKKFKDSRIHFAIVCASLSCPQLRSEAFEGYKLNEQLNDQGVKFFNHNSRNRFDLKSKTAYLSKILDWYSSDFGKNDRELLMYAAKYAEAPAAKSMINNTGAWKIEYLDYDWSLNKQK